MVTMRTAIVQKTLSVVCNKLSLTGIVSLSLQSQNGENSLWRASWSDISQRRKSDKGCGSLFRSPLCLGSGGQSSIYATSDPIKMDRGKNSRQIGPCLSTNPARYYQPFRGSLTYAFAQVFQSS
jgi:hypothetical protein